MQVELWVLALGLGLQVLQHLVEMELELEPEQTLEQVLEHVLVLGLELVPTLLAASSQKAQHHQHGWRHGNLQSQPFQPGRLVAVHQRHL